MRAYLQHKLSAWHVYCRLIDFGLSRSCAKKIAGIYQKVFAYRLLYRKRYRREVVIKT